MREKRLLQSGWLGKTLSLAGLAIALCAAGTQKAGASTVSLVPSTSTINVGDSVTVDVNVSGLGTALGGYDVTVDYPSIFTLNNVSFGDPILGDQLALSGVSSLTSTVPATNAEQLIELSLNTVTTLNTLQAPAFTMAVLNFTANGAGSGNFTLGGITLSDASGKVISSSISNATVSAVSAVPEPSTVIPLAGMLVLLAVMRKRLFRAVGSSRVL